MNKKQKEVQQAFLDSEKEVLKKLKKNYQDALEEINTKIEILLARQDADMQHVIYQVEYQKALKTQVQGILDTLQANEFETVSEYLAKSYEDGFIGTVYDMQGQGIPLIMPIDQEQVVKAIQHETKLSESLYNSLGKDIKVLNKQIAGEISRGISTGMMFSEISRNIAGYAGISRNKAMRIARTEGHRIQCKATMDACYKAKEKGADVVKQWDASLDGKTRPTHRKLDGQIRELEEEFEVSGYKAMMPGGFNKASEDINCRCALLQRARWALDEEELATLQERAEYYGLDKTDDFEDFKKKYLKAVDSERVRGSTQKISVEDEKNKWKELNEKYSSADEAFLMGSVEDYENYVTLNERFGEYIKEKTKLPDPVPINDAIGLDEFNSQASERLGFKVNFTKGSTEYAKEQIACYEELANEYKQKTEVVEFGTSGMLGKGAVAETFISPDYKYATISVSGKNAKKSKFGKLESYTVVVDDMNENISDLTHEFAHTLANSKHGDEDFWKEIKSIKMRYNRELTKIDKENIVEKTISNEEALKRKKEIYISEYANKTVDEFMAEAFCEAKLSSNPSPYSKQVLEVVDKYFKKEVVEETLENTVKSSTIVSGGVSGARNPFGTKAKEHAERYYGLVRSMTTDVEKISRVTGISEEDVQAVKNFIFLDKHDLGGKELEFFEPDYMMAESWQRLVDGKPEKHDITMLNHELMEKELIQSGLPQDEAHIQASKEYNYAREAGEYYAKIEKYKKE